jgi:Peptidase propeptide and YPEB domain
MEQPTRPTRNRYGGRVGKSMPALCFIALLCAAPSWAGEALQPRGAGEAPIGIREPARSAPGISMDDAIQAAERRYKARVVKANTVDHAGRRVYVLRLLSDEGRVWTIRIDSQSGGAL